MGKNRPPPHTNRRPVQAAGPIPVRPPRSSTAPVRRARPPRPTLSPPVHVRARPPRPATAPRRPRPSAAPVRPDRECVSRFHKIALIDNEKTTYRGDLVNILSHPCAPSHCAARPLWPFVAPPRTLAPATPLAFVFRRRRRRSERRSSEQTAERRCGAD